MIFICGFYHLGRADVLRYSGACGHCGRAASLSCFTARKFAHIYYIPVWPEARDRVVDYCNRCRHYHSIRVADVPGAVESTRQAGWKAIGEENWPDAAGAAVWLAKLGDFAEAERLAGHMPPDAAGALASLAGYFEVMGRPEDAEDALRKAVAIDADDPDVRYLLGEFLADCGRLEEGLAEMLAAADLARPEQATAMRLNILGLLKLNKRWAEAAPLVERVAADDPALLEDKKFARFARKVRRKAGVHGAEANPYHLR